MPDACLQPKDYLFTEVQYYFPKLRRNKKINIIFWNPFLLPGVIKLKVHIRGAKCTASMGTELLHQKIEDLRNNVNPMSDQTNKFIVQLREEGIKILSSQLDRHGVVVWIWCRTQAALVHIQKLYQSNQLKDVFFEPTCIQPSTSVLINIDINQFKKTIGKFLWMQSS